MIIFYFVVVRINQVESSPASRAEMVALVLRVVVETRAP